MTTVESRPGAAPDGSDVAGSALDIPASAVPTLTRRGFLAAAGGVVFAFSVPAVAAPRRAAAATQTPISAWITIASDGTTTIQVGSTEMGQGVLTSLAQIVAEELRVDWSAVRSQHSPAAAVYGNPAYGGSQVTGGSYSVRGYYDTLRLAGASVCTMLRNAAAQAWGVKITTTTAAHGVVTHTPTGRTMTYGQLAPAAAKLAPPKYPQVRDPSTFTLIGTSVARTDIPEKTTGAAVYGNDVRLPGMLYAATKHCSVLGSTVQSVGTAPAGTSAVNLGDCVAVIAPTWFGAFSAAQKIAITWSTPSSSAQLDSTVILNTAKSLMANPPSVVTAETAGNARSAVASAPKSVNVTYDVPFLPHACMEPVTCTALVTSTSCTLWASTQVQTAAVQTAASVTGLPTSAITVHTTLLGSGMGRKLETDFIAQAVKIAKTKPGTPVQLMWPRREDFANDFFRPMALLNVQAGLSSSGAITGWVNRIVTPSILMQKGYISAGQLDDQAVEGAVTQPYTWGSRLVEWVQHPAAVPIGFWRSVGHSFNAFAVESAMDELAKLAGKDPIAFRLANLPAGSRHAAVLSAVKTLSGWGSVPSGHAQGVALHDCFGTVVGLVVEVSQPTSGTIRVHKAACVVDCGMAVHPDQVKAQMEGGIVHGLNAALFGKLTLTKGVVSPTNFDKFRMLRMSEMPAVTVQILNSGAALGGIGEPGSPPVAPAIANAWAKLTGTRLRSLPMF